MAADEAYVWVWLPGETQPVVAGRVRARRSPVAGAPEMADFVYGQSYLDRAEAVPLYLPELPLRRGAIPPRGDLTVAGVIADAGPDAWGRRVVLRELTGWAGRDADVDQVGVLTYLLHSGSNRTGALDFQESSDVYLARGGGTVEELVEAAARVDDGGDLRPELRDALFAGSSLGGARPKVAVSDGERHLIGKLSSKTDTTPVVRAEALAMELARRCGIVAAHSWLGDPVDGRDILWVERFDRVPGGARRMMVSALTMLELPEHAGRHATYVRLADVIIERFTEPTATLHELFRRIVFNVCVSNTDDHARNHAAFWHPPAQPAGPDGAWLTLTPAYDIEPQNRTGGEAVQAMAYGPRGYRLSHLAGCATHAAVYRHTRASAREVIDGVVGVISDQYSEAADLARLTRVERDQLWGRQVLNPFALEGY